MIAQPGYNTVRRSSCPSCEGIPVFGERQGSDFDTLGWWGKNRAVIEGLLRELHTGAPSVPRLLAVMVQPVVHHTIVASRAFQEKLPPDSGIHVTRLVCDQLRDEDLKREVPRSPESDVEVLRTASDLRTLVEERCRYALTGPRAAWWIEKRDEIQGFLDRLCRGDGEASGSLMTLLEPVLSEIVLARYGTDRRSVGRSTVHSDVCYELFRLFRTRRPGDGLPVTVLGLKRVVESRPSMMLRRYPRRPCVDDTPCWNDSASGDDRGALAQEVMDGAAGPARRAEKEDLLRHALDMLGERERQIVELKLFDSLSFTEIAQQFGVDRRTVSRHYDAAIRRLRTHLAGDCQSW